MFARDVLQANTIRSPYVGLMLGRRRRRRPNIKPTLGEGIAFASTSQSGR